jgi:hypothetical protein
LIGFWYAWTNRNMSEKSTSPGLPAWIRTALLIQGVILTALALALLLTPEFMLTVWPWKVTRMLIQIYSGPFLAYGICSLLLSRQRTWSAVRIVVSGFFVLTIGVLIASTIHRSLFSFTNPATWIWFGGFTLMLVLHALIMFLNRTNPGATQ